MSKNDHMIHSEKMNFWNFSLGLNRDNFDGKKLAEDGLADFTIYFENPHGKRSIALKPEACSTSSLLKNFSICSNNKERASA